MAFLTIVPSDRTELLGLIAKVPNADWVALDAREEGYDRLVATEMITHDHSDNPELAIYAIPEATRFPPTPDHPILLSYLDVVLQGYLHVFGDGGSRRSTLYGDHGWVGYGCVERSLSKNPGHGHPLRPEFRQSIHAQIKYKASIVKRG